MSQTEKIKNFLIGFPVDAGEKTEPFYYLVLHDKNEFNQGVKSDNEIKKLESINDSQMDHVLRKLNEEKKYLVFISSSEKQKDLIPDALPDGNSSTLACLLAGYKEDINYENYSEKSKNPVLMVSCSIYGKPELLKEAQLSRVTSSNSDFSKNSLKRKWNVIKNIQKKGTPVAFILHNDDFTLIKEVLSSDEYEEKSINEITELFDDGQKKPFLVSVEADDFKKLAQKVKISFDKPSPGEKLNQPLQILILTLLTTAGLALGGYFYYENQKAEAAEAERKAFCDSVSMEEIKEMKLTDIDEKITKAKNEGCSEKIKLFEDEKQKVERNCKSKGYDRIKIDPKELEKCRLD